MAPRILIIRLSAIGDIIFTTALLPALRQRWPDAHITWLTTPIGEELLDGHPLIDEILVLPRSIQRGNFPPLLSDGWSLARALRERHFTLAIDAQGLLKSAVWAIASGAPRRVGLRPREGAHLLYTERVDAALERTPDLPAREYRRLAEHLELPVDSFAMKLAPGSARTPGATAPVCLMPFTTRPQKHWFADRWAALAARLHSDGVGPLMLLGGPDDGEEAARIVEAAQVPVEIIAGPASNLRDKRDLIAGAALTIGVDTGLTHMSIALGRPTVALFGSTCPYLRTDPAPGRVLYEALSCAPCRRHPTCDGAFDCMRAHTVARVYDAAIALRHAAAAPTAHTGD